MIFSITGITGLKNRGVEALLHPIVTGLKSRFPASEIQVVTRTPAYDSAHWTGPACEWLDENPARPAPRSRIRRGKLLLKEWLGAGRGSGLAGQLSRSDVVILAGGDMLCYGPDITRRVIEPLLAAARSGKKIILLGQSIGPFQTEAETALFRALYEVCQLVAVRDQVSFDYLTGPLGLNPGKLVKYADSAYLLEPDRQVLAWWDSRFQPGDKVIGISLSVGISGWAGMKYGEYLDAWVGHLSRILNETDSKICLIPHVQDSGRSDSEVCTAVFRKLGYDPRVVCAGLDFSAAEFKAIISRCRMLVAERMHAAVGAFSTGVPASIVAYSAKAEGMANEMLGADYARLFGYFPLAELREPDAVIRRIQAINGEYEGIVRKLEQTRASARASADAVYDRIAEVLKR